MLRYVVTTYKLCALMNDAVVRIYVMCLCQSLSSERFSGFGSKGWFCKWCYLLLMRWDGDCCCFSWNCFFVWGYQWEEWCRLAPVVFKPRTAWSGSENVSVFIESDEIATNFLYGLELHYTTNFWHYIVKKDK